MARNKKEIQATCNEIESEGDIKPLGFVCDVGKTAEIDHTVKKILKTSRTIDILINAAGVQAPIGPFVENKIKEWEENVRINLFGTVAMCHAIAPIMMRRRAGSIINFAGGGATASRPNFSAYAAAKTAVVRFTEILADEIKKNGVQVNALAPGAVNTQMLDEVIAVGSRAGKEFEMAKKRAKEGGVSPDVAAGLCLFLASPRARGLTGRLISAPWDNWEGWKKKDIKEIMKSEKFTLRRITK